jgi:replicative DNA helicase
LTDRSTPRTAEIPDDVEAEQCVVGILTATADGARQVAEVLTPEDFYRPGFGRAMDVACQLDSRFDNDHRVAIIANLAGLAVRELEALASSRPSNWDADRWVARVKASARRRRVMALAAEIYNNAAAASTVELTELIDELGMHLAAIPAEHNADPLEPSGPRRTIAYFRHQREGAAP